jgi:hypothetical protein
VSKGRFGSVERRKEGGLQYAVVPRDQRWRDEQAGTNNSLPQHIRPPQLTCNGTSGAVPASSPHCQTRPVRLTARSCMSSGSPFHRKPCPAIESREHLKTEDAVVSDRRVPAFTPYSCGKCLRTCISNLECGDLSPLFVRSNSPTRNKSGDKSPHSKSCCIRQDFEVKTKLRPCKHSSTASLPLSFFSL